MSLPQVPHNKVTIHSPKRHGGIVWGAVLVLLVAHAGLIAYSLTRQSPTFYEPAHLVAGIAHWRSRHPDLNSVDPPLVPMVAALPVMALGYNDEWSGHDVGPAERPEFAAGRAFVSANGTRSLWLILVARWVCVPFSLIGALFCFLWSRALWASSLAGILSLSLWCFDPNILAHGGLITPDCAASSFGLGASYLFWRWLKRPSWHRVFAAGVLLGIAALTKSMWIILFGIYPFLWLLWLSMNDRRETSSPVVGHRVTCCVQVSQLTASLLAALCILNIGYACDQTFSCLGDYTFVSSSMSGRTPTGAPGNRFRAPYWAGLRIPLPMQYVLGIDAQKQECEKLHETPYLHTGWWDRIYAVGVKVPHGTQLLVVLAVATLLTLCGRSHRYPRDVRVSSRDVAALLMPTITLGGIVVFQVAFMEGYRCIMPTFGFLFVFVGVTALWFRGNLRLRNACPPENG